MTRRTGKTLAPHRELERAAHALATDARPKGLPPGSANERKVVRLGRVSAGAHPDERTLWNAVLLGATPREAGRALNMPTKRVLYLCEKWARRGIYDYGVTADLGQPTTDRTDQGDDQ